MMIMSYISKAFTMAPHIVVKKVARKVKRLVSETIMRRRDEKMSSYANDFPLCQIHSYFSGLSVENLLPYTETISIVTKYYLDHRFDLLGSGWVNVKHGMHCQGLEGYRYGMGCTVDADSEGQWLAGRINRANLEESKRVWQLIFSESSYCKADGSKNRTYCPIDWHLDFKSGYRWKEFTWYRDIPYGHKPGVDIKLPWELARMQHLPMLAWAYALAKDGVDGFCLPDKYAGEFRNQILDFIANNPPRFGVNWYCTMDVAIRVVNWLVAYDLFRSYGALFGKSFENIFVRSIYEHGLHIINNLEWSEEIRSNHYLSDIVGLLFVAAYLQRSPVIDSWFAFAIQELIKEVKFQFYPDGSNFEASTSYHRLSAEMVVYATALVLGLHYNKVDALKKYDHTLIKVKPGLNVAPLSYFKLTERKNSISKNGSYKSESPFPTWYFERLEKMAEFVIHITKHNNHIHQIGDNDSGRFFKFQPTYNKMSVDKARKQYLNLADYHELPSDAFYLDEDFLDHRHLVAAINGLFDRHDFFNFAGSEYLETAMIRKLAGDVCLSSYRKKDKPMQAEKVLNKISEGVLNELRSIFEAKHECQKHMNIPLPKGATDNLKLYAYPDFGLYIYYSKRIYFAIRCGSIDWKGIRGHAHNDQLSIELNVDGKDWIVDPGTYIYTPLLERRNEYRSVTAHFAPQVIECEPGDISVNTFILGGNPKAEAICFNKNEFIGKHIGYGSPIYRQIAIESDMLMITDYFFECNFVQYGNKKILFSSGYGRIQIHNIELSPKILIKDVVLK